METFVSCASGVPRPVYPHEIAVFIENNIDMSVESTLDRLANAARQMDVRRRDDDTFCVLLDTDDAVEWMLLFSAAS
jgi:hypothetical protein